jgi:hypothetical protein
MAPLRTLFESTPPIDNMTNIGINGLLIAIGTSLVGAHMQMSNPFPLRSPLDPDVSWEVKDYSMTSPLNSDGSNFPCKGYQTDTEETPKAQYIAGQSYSMSIAGSAGHGGGSCQLSLSYDNGLTFHVIKSMIGGCVAQAGSYDFTIPSFAPTGLALFAWSWMNFEGNREYYMDCAVVQVTGQTTDVSQLGTLLPNLFVANLATINDCVIPEGTDTVFPHPGCDVQYGNGQSPASAPFAGDCDNSSGPGIDWCSGQTGLAVGNAIPSPLATGNASMAATLATVSSSPSPLATIASSNTAIAYSAGVEESSGVAFYPATANYSAPTPTMSVPMVPPPAAHAVAQPRPQAEYIGSAPSSSFGPCKLGTFLCASSKAFYTCQYNASGGTGYGMKQQVAGGMMCQPHLNGGRRSYRDDRIVRAQPHGACDTEGVIRCVSDGAQFQMCAQGAWIAMGMVAAGTRCVNGKMVAMRR